MCVCVCVCGMYGVEDGEAEVKEDLHVMSCLVQATCDWLGENVLSTLYSYHCCSKQKYGSHNVK